MKEHLDQVLGLRHRGVGYGEQAYDKRTNHRLPCTVHLSVPNNVSKLSAVNLYWLRRQKMLAIAAYNSQNQYTSFGCQKTNRPACTACSAKLALLVWSLSLSRPDSLIRQTPPWCWHSVYRLRRHSASNFVSLRNPATFDRLTCREAERYDANYCADNSSYIGGATTRCSRHTWPCGRLCCCHRIRHGVRFGPGNISDRNGATRHNVRGPSSSK